MQVLSSLSGIPFYAPSAGFSPTNSADVSAIASSYQIVSSTATQLYAGTAYLTSVNDNPLSAARAGQAANASMANTAYYDGTGRLISSLPDSATVSAIASSYAESAASSKQDALTYGYNAANQISSIDGSALGGMDEAAVSGIASAYAESAVSSVSGNYYTTANESGFLTAQVQASWSESASASPSYIQDKPDLVDIVAGPGIVVDNPDGNTLRVSMAADYEVELWSGVYSGSVNSSNFITLSENPRNFETIEITNGGIYKSKYSFAGSSVEWSFMQTYAGSASTVVYANRYSVDAVNKKVTCAASNSFTVRANSVSDWMSRSMDVGEVQLIRVVGIHRITNN